MPKDINTTMQTEKDAEQNQPVELYQVYLDEETLYLANHPENIEFFDENGNAQTYYAAALSRSKVETNTDTKVDSTKVQLDNVNREMSAYIANTEFVGRKMKIWKVFTNQLDSPDNYIPVFDGYMDKPEINQYSMSVTVVSNLDTLDKRLPGRTFSPKCQWVFGSEECGVTIPTKSGTIDSISGTTINDSDITEAADYWKHGTIESDNESRVITGSGSGYVEVEYPFTTDIESGDSYNMKAGCDKSYDSGHGCTFWNNTQYYGGFLSIPKIRDIREG